MQFSKRLMLSLLAGVAAVSFLFATLQSWEEVRSLTDQTTREQEALAEGQHLAAQHLVEQGNIRDLRELLAHFGDNGHLAGAAIYGQAGQLLATSPGLVLPVGPAPDAVIAALRTTETRRQNLRVGGETLRVYALPLNSNQTAEGAIVVFHHANLLISSLWRHALSIVMQTVLIVGITLLIVRWSLGERLRRMAEWLRDLRTGAAGPKQGPPKEAMLQGLASEAERLANSLSAARAAAEEEARLRAAGLAQWTPERLRVTMLNRLNGSRVFAVSNREPYVHSRQGGAVTWSVPPSGLVTALEPVLCASDGTWVAQATGDADRETSDDSGRLQAPPDHPQYTLRRVWLSKQEEDGFYLGFANEGLWPLCHIAHTRPIFRSEDWEQYKAVNRKFANAVLEEMRTERNPTVLVQDYHFALLPRMIKEKRPDARVSIFWHIPWPNPEAFGICPFQRELLEGMLGADLIGFHIQQHCNNFLETVNQAVESRIDWEHFAVSRNQHLTAVRPFPISVAMTGEIKGPEGTSPEEREAIVRELGYQPDYLLVGVDRIDYTKGIPERLRGVERLLDQFPFYRERLSFVQIGAPSRGTIRRYQDLMTEVEEECARINQKFKSGKWQPIVFLKGNYSHAQIQPYYRAADVCLVTSLHDGMNLVAKEYIASRNDEQGVLVLSRFAGASHELSDALAVNPYDTDELAQAIHTGLSMPAEEKRARMRRLRTQVREHNIYRWAGDLLSELASIRVENPPQPIVRPGARTVRMPFPRAERAAG